MKILAALTILVTGLVSLSTAFVPAATKTGTRSVTTASSLWATRTGPSNDDENDLKWSTHNGIGQDWDRHWERKYMELRAEKSWNDRLAYVENPRLWLWLHIQKENMRRGVMRRDRREKLAELGYVTEIRGSNDAASYFSPSNPPPTKAFLSTMDMFPPTPPPVTHGNL